MRTGTVAASAICAARYRRAPEMISKPRSFRGRTSKGERTPWLRMLSALCSVGYYVADAAMSRMAAGGARSEGHITITVNRAISATARRHAILYLGGVTPKLCREAGRPPPQPFFLSG